MKSPRFESRFPQKTETSEYTIPRKDREYIDAVRKSHEHTNEEKIEMIHDTLSDAALDAIKKIIDGNEPEPSPRYTPVQDALAKMVRNELKKTFTSEEIYTFPDHINVCIPPKFQIFGMDGSVTFDTNTTDEYGNRIFSFRVHDNAVIGKKQREHEYYGCIYISAAGDTIKRVVLSEGIDINKPSVAVQKPHDEVQLDLLPEITLSAITLTPEYEFRPYLGGTAENTEGNNETSPETIITDVVSTTMIHRKRTFDNPRQTPNEIQILVKKLVDSLSRKHQEVLLKFNNGTIPIDLYILSQGRYLKPRSFPSIHDPQLIQEIVTLLGQGQSVTAIPHGCAVPRKYHNLPPLKSPISHTRRTRRGIITIAFPNGTDPALLTIRQKIVSGDRSLQEEEIEWFAESTGYTPATIRKYRDNNAYYREGNIRVSRGDIIQPEARGADKDNVSKYKVHFKNKGLDNNQFH